jgi:hypothetical protein
VGGGVGGKEADALSSSGAELGVMGLSGEGATTAISDSRRRSGGEGAAVRRCNKEVEASLRPRVAGGGSK